jgi:hypothetical protein
MICRLRQEGTVDLGELNAADFYHLSIFIREPPARHQKRTAPANLATPPIAIHPNSQAWPSRLRPAAAASSSRGVAPSANPSIHRPRSRCSRSWMTRVAAGQSPTGGATGQVKRRADDGHLEQTRSACDGAEDPALDCVVDESRDS